MLKQFQEQLVNAEAAAANARSAYHKARDEKISVEKRLRKACDEASHAVNLVAALEAAIEKLPDGFKPVPKVKIPKVAPKPARGFWSYFK